MHGSAKTQGGGASLLGRRAPSRPKLFSWSGRSASPNRSATSSWPAAWPSAWLDPCCAPLLGPPQDRALLQQGLQLRVQTWDMCDSYGRFRVRLAEMWDSLKIIPQATLCPFAGKTYMMLSVSAILCGRLHS